MLQETKPVTSVASVLLLCSIVTGSNSMFTLQQGVRSGQDTLLWESSISKPKKKERKAARSTATLYLDNWFNLLTLGGEKARGHLAPIV